MGGGIQKSWKLVSFNVPKVIIDISKLYRCWSTHLLTSIVAKHLLISVLIVALRHYCIQSFNAVQEVHHVSYMELAGCHTAGSI